MYSVNSNERTRPQQMATRRMFLFSTDVPFFSTAFTLRQHLDAVGQRFGRGDCMPAVEEMGIAHTLDWQPRSFSGGERWRAEVAVALHRGPACRLADEPFRGIDPGDRETITAALWRLADVIWCESGTTTHPGTPSEARASWRFGREVPGRV